jgi:hypothetical protein
MGVVRLDMRWSKFESDVVWEVRCVDTEKGKNAEKTGVGEAQWDMELGLVRLAVSSSHFPFISCNELELSSRSLSFELPSRSLDIPPHM